MLFLFSTPFRYCLFFVIVSVLPPLGPRPPYTGLEPSTLASTLLHWPLVWVGGQSCYDAALSVSDVEVVSTVGVAQAASSIGGEGGGTVQETQALR